MSCFTGRADVSLGPKVVSVMEVEPRKTLQTDAQLPPLPWPLGQRKRETRVVTRNQQAAHATHRVGPGATVVCPTDGTK